MCESREEMRLERGVRGQAVKTIYHPQEKSITGSGFPQNTDMTEVRLDVSTQTKKNMNADPHRHQPRQQFNTLCSSQHIPEAQPHSWNVRQGLWRLLSMPEQVVLWK